jgi:hypothetical protein
MDNEMRDKFAGHFKNLFKRATDVMLACSVSFFLFPVKFLPKISPILFLNEKLRKTAVNPPNFLGFGKNITPFAIKVKLCFQEIFTPFFGTLGHLTLMNL